MAFDLCDQCGRGYMSDSEVTVFIVQGRENEISQLQLRLNSALAGNPQVAFVAGDAGVGKTVLVREFCRLAQESNPKLVVAWGECSTQRGLSEPYLPFKEIISLLAGNVENSLVTNTLSKENESRLKRLMAHTGEAIVELGPDLVGTFIPGVGLLLRAGAFVAKKAGWLKSLEKLVKNPPSREQLKPEQLFEQFGRVVVQVSKKAPLILVLDDLHWSDKGTLDLLFYFTRRIRNVTGLSLLIVGMYRLAEVKLGREGSRHPLEPVLNETKRYWGEVEISLMSTVGGTNGRRFVDALLDTEPNRLDENFRALIFQRTEGHPLFTIELLRALQEREVITRDNQSRWFVCSEVTLEELPDRIEAVLNERIGRVDQDLREVLACGCVEGQTFTAEVMAQVLHREKLWLAHRLDEELTQLHQLILPAGEVELNHQRLHFYRFRHPLFQQYLYESLGPLRREELHAAIGKAVEELYQEHVSSIAGKLAWHFDLAGEADKAIKYYYEAATQARQIFAHDNALNLYDRALELLRTDTDPELHFGLLSGRRRIYRLQGKKTEEFTDLTEMLKVGEQINDVRLLAKTRDWRASYYVTLNDYETAKKESQEGLRAAREAQDLQLISQCLSTMALATRWGGDLKTALNVAQEGLVAAQRAGDQEEEADSLIHLGLIRFDLGEFDKARAYLESALAIFQSIRDRLGECNSHYLLSYVAYGCGNFAEAHCHSEQALALSRKVGNREHEAETLNSLAIYYLDLGDYPTAVSYCEQALSIYREIEDRRGEALGLLNLGLALGEQGRFRDALERLEQALYIGRSIGGKRTEAYALTYMGLVFEGLGQSEEASRAYAQAVDLRRHLGQDALSIDGLAGLARTALSMGQLSDAQGYTRQILQWISKNGAEGIECPIRVYRTCTEVLQASGESARARAIAGEAYTLLMGRADRIDNPELRHSFLNNVSFNREIAEIWAESQGESTKTAPYLDEC